MWHKTSIPDGSVDFQKQFGYGIATLYGRGTQQTDPNDRIKQSLTPADQLAYDKALSGGNPQQTFYVAADTGDFSQLGGCIKQATDSLFGGSQLLTTLQRRLDELDDSILQDQRMVRAFEQWTTCVRQKTGENYEDSEAVEVDIVKRLAAVVGPLPEGEFAAGAFASATPEGPYDAAALEEVRRLEVESRMPTWPARRSTSCPWRTPSEQRKNGSFARPMPSCCAK